MMSSFLGAALFSVVTWAASEDAAARAAASSWLSVVDAGRYQESWEEASAAFRENMARFGKSVEFWVKALGAARTPLGSPVSRSVIRVAPIDAMPGGPAGRRYLELVYDSDFEHADPVTESVVMTLDDDGVWRMFNYVIRREGG
jgi:hypothetical protein